MRLPIHRDAVFFLKNHNRSRDQITKARFWKAILASDLRRCGQIRQAFANA